MSALRHPLFLSCALSYLILRMAAGFGLMVPYLHGHLTDLLCMPVVLTLAVVAAQCIHTKFRLDPLVAWATCAVFCLYFEVILPDINPNFTADVLDMMAYSAGAFVFLRINNTAAYGEPRRIPPMGT